MLCPHFYERMKRARCNVQTEALLKEACDIAVGLSFPAQFADQVSMGFQLGAWKLGREVGKPGKNNLRVSIRGGRKRMHRYPAGRPKSPDYDHEQVVGRIVGDIVGRPENRSPLSPQYPVTSRSQGYLRVSTRALLSDTYRNLGSLITQRSVVQIHPPQPSEFAIDPLQKTPDRVCGVSLWILRGLSCRGRQSMNRPAQKIIRCRKPKSLDIGVIKNAVDGLDKILSVGRGCPLGNQPGNVCQRQQ